MGYAAMRLCRSEASVRASEVEKTVCSAFAALASMWFGLRRLRCLQTMCGL